MLSLAHQRRGKPVPVLSWSLTMHRAIEAVRDRIFDRCGTREPLFEVGPDAHPIGYSPVTRQWRKPLSIEEVARMAPTPEVRERKGRP